MPDQHGAPVGSVAEEAARLLDALGGWASTAQGAYAGEAPSEPGRCPTCGAPDGVARAASCASCPVCKGIGLLRSVKPETVDRLAELAVALAGALRDVASTLRTEAGTTAAADKARPADGPFERRHGARVQDIRVDDEDQHTERPGSATP